MERNSGVPAADAARGYAAVVNAFAADPAVVHGTGKGFGSGSLKVNGKIFAMLTSKGQFVVKLPKARVQQFVEAGQGEPFDPGHGRRMKEWLTVHADPSEWVALAEEARAYAGG